MERIDSGVQRELSKMSLKYSPPPKSTNPYDPPRLKSPELLQRDEEIRFVLHASTGPVEPAWLRRTVYWLILKTLVRQVPLVAIFVLAALFLSQSPSPPLRILSSMAFILAQAIVVIILLRLILLYLKRKGIPSEAIVEDVTIKAYAKGFVFQSADYEQFSVWPLLSLVCSRHNRLLIIGQTILSRSGIVLNVKRLEGSFGLGALSSMVALQIQKQSRTEFGPEMLSQREFESVRFEHPMAIFQGHVLAGRMAKSDRASWWLSGLQLFWVYLSMALYVSTCLMFVIRLIASRDNGYVPLLLVPTFYVH